MAANQLQEIANRVVVVGGLFAAELQHSMAVCSECELGDAFVSAHRCKVHEIASSEQRGLDLVSFSR